MKKRGTSLLEVILAIAMMVLSMIPIFGLMSSSNTASRGQKIEGVASNLAKEVMNKWMYILDPSSWEDLDDGEVFLENGGPFNIEGNEVEIKVRIYRHLNTSTNIKYPEFEWHNFRATCSGGAETTDLDSKTNVVTRTMAEVTKGDSRTFRLIDIVLEVRWKTPNTNWSDTNRFFLLSRRGYM